MNTTFEAHHHRGICLAGTVRMADMQVGWRKPLDVTGLTWTEPQELGGRQLASVEHIKTTKALLDMVTGEFCGYSALQLS